MKKYVGQYRVDIERDIITGDHLINGQTFLRVPKAMKENGGKIYRYNENILVAYVPNKTTGARLYAKSIEKVHLYKIVEYDDGMDLYFKEEYIREMAKIMMVSTNGSNIPPESIKNHPRRKEIREQRKANMSEEQLEIMRNRGLRLFQNISNSSENSSV